MVEFEDFVAQQWIGLSRFARLLADDRDQAEDLLAETLAKAHRAWPRIASAQHPLAYVRRILTTTAISHRRAWHTRSVRPTRTGWLPDQPATDEIAALDDRAEVATLLATLPPKQRAAVAMRYLLDLPDAAIADALGCTAGTVRGYISRSLVALRVTAGVGDD